MIGRLDQVILIERKGEARDAGGGAVVSWSPLSSDPRPFARVELLGGGEGDRQARQAARFTIRARADLRAADRISWGGYLWNIEAVGRPVARARYQTIMATAGELSQ